MHKFYLSKIKYEKTSEEGKVVKVSEQYLVDALSFTECEARIIQEMQPFISGEFEVAAIQKKNYSEIVDKYSNMENNKWFECKLNFIVVDEKGNEKKTPVFILVAGDCVSNANETLIEHMRGSMADYTIEGVKETKIIDVFKYEK